MYKKKTPLWVILITLCLFFASSVQAKAMDRIAAIVNDQVITESQVNQRITMIKQQIKATNTAVPPEKKLWREALDQLIDIELQLQIAKKANITTDDAAIDQTLTNMAKQHNLTLSQLPDALRKEGIDYQLYRDNLRQNMIINQLQQKEIGPQVKLPKRALNDLKHTLAKQPAIPAEYHLQDIVVLLPDNPSNEQVQTQEKLAKELLDKIRQGETFEQVTRYAAAKGLSVQGGDLGFRKPAELPQLFVQNINTMKPGDIMGPLRAPNGFHLLKLIGTRGGSSYQQHYSTETHLRHILIKNNPLNSERSIKARLAELRYQIINGEDFAKIAQSHSEDPNSAGRGGDLGWVKAGTFDPLFEQVINQLKPGTTSHVFASQSGWHLAQVLERRQVEDSKEFLQEKSRQMLYQQKFSESVKNWLQQLRSQAYIKIIN